MGKNQGAPGGTPSRRRMLRLAGGGLALSALGAGASGCREDTAGGGGGDAGGGSDSPAATDGPAEGAPGGGGQAPEPLWTKTTSARTYGDNDELVAVDGVVIATGDPVTARDAQTGKPTWSPPGGAVPGAPLLLGNGTLYLASGTYDGTVHGYEPVSGKETWRSRLGTGYRQPRPIAVDDGQVYVIAEILEADGSSHTNVIAALDGGSGRPAWKRQRDLGTEQNGIHAAVSGRYLVYTDVKKNLTVRDTATGGQVWTQKTTKTNYGAFAVHRDLVIVPQGSRLQAFALSDGSRKWSVRTDDDFATFKEPAVVGDSLFVADSARTLRHIEPQTGRKVWRSEDLADAKAKPPRQFVIAGDTLYGATDLDEQGGVHAFDAGTGALRWTFNDGTGDYHAWLVTTDGTHVFALHGRKLHALPA
ncbi:PQQ-binding-like beta-propeller repeat protein [Streptomyces synnematoformans]|uniref:PQQ-binding-like beta-propeller repeat protein n=1 Tax=Streptomyces synnematoformans TaxID=415721 RepID=A0ABN2XMR9_9ACTN